jgi:beta-phosphoglucomutase-like phosphatase (HAD superfamily)
VTFRAVVFDFNGTLSDDEPILYRVYSEMFAEHGRPLSERDYYDELAGLSEEEILVRWLGRSNDSLVAERIARYRALVSGGETVYPEVREAVGYAAGKLPVAIVSGAALEEIEPVVDAAGLTGSITAIVAADHVANGKPHPEGYLRAAELLAVEPDELLAFEDTEAGVASARAAGAHVVGITRTLGPERLRQAHELAERIDTELVRRLLP